LKRPTNHISSKFNEDFDEVESTQKGIGGNEQESSTWYHMVAKGRE
jgi:hypothetical protein